MVVRSMKVSVLKSDLAGLSDVYPEDHDGRDTEDIVNHISKTI